MKAVQTPGLKPHREQVGHPIRRAVDLTVTALFDRFQSAFFANTLGREWMSSELVVHCLPSISKSITRPASMAGGSMAGCQY